MALPKIAPVQPTFTNNINSREEQQPETENERKVHLLRAFVPLIIAGQLIIISMALWLQFSTDNSIFLLISAILGFLTLPCVLIGYRWAISGNFYRGAWLLVGSLLLELTYSQWLVGSELVVTLAFIGCLALAAILLPIREIVLTTCLWIIYTIGIYLGQNFFHFYDPPISFNPETWAIINLLILILVVVSLLIILIIPQRSQIKLLQTQNRQLETLLVEHNLTRARLQENEERLRATFEQAAVGMAQMTLDGCFWQVNQKFCEIIGYSREELLGRGLLDVTHPDDRADSNENSHRLLRGEVSSFTQEKRYTRKDGAPVWANVTVSLIFDSKGEPKYFSAVIRDITNRKRAEEQVFFQASLLNQVRNAVIATDLQGNIIYWNKSAELLYQWKSAETLGKNIRDLLESPDNREHSENAQAILLAEDHWEGEFPARRKDGSTILVYTTNTAIKDVESRLQCLVWVSMDNSERKQTEEALADEKERLAVTLRSIGDGVITTDTQGCILLINSVAENLTGWTQEEAVGRSLPEVFNIINSKTGEAAANPVEKVLQTGSIVGLASRTALLARDGTERFISNSAAPIDRNGQIIGVVLVFRDVTDRMRLEEELQKHQKLESLGILAGGIAHDFNNILTAIVGNIFMAKMESRPEDIIYELLTEAETASFRAKDLTQQLLTFSRGGAPIKKTASIKELLKESVGFALRGSKVRSKFYIPDDLWTVEIDAGQINQVINNLVINADQAMPNGGQLTVSAENVRQGSFNPGLPLKEGEYVRITFRDEGIGIPPQNLSKIFDPYFTTKQKGSGLGLATSFSIVNRHDGYISVQSEMGVGTTFEIYLPASPTKKVLEEKIKKNSPTGHGRVLLMDDDKMIRDLGARALKQLGYEVDVAHDGNEVLELYQKAMVTRKPYDVVITDLTVQGGMGGKEAVSNLLKIDPNVKAIVSSGYSNDPVMANYEAYHFRGVLTKPFMIDELSHKIESLIHPES
jgi:PAS domain S-box-containing protein